MLDIPTIKKLFAALNEELKKVEALGEIGICGGAVMCLVFASREATKDVDAIFKPTEAIRRASQKIARDFGLPENWLNDAAKAYFHVDPPREEVLTFSHLRVWAPKADYMLAMKCVSARFDTHDKEDVVFLLNYLGLKKTEAVFQIIEKYYPRQRIPPKTRFLIEEIFAGKS